MKNSLLLLLTVILSAAIVFAQDPAASGQTPTPIQFAPNSVIPAKLSKSLDAKKSKAGDQVEAKTIMDMRSQGKIVLPKDTKLLGHVTAAQARSKESPDSMVGIAFDRAVMKDGGEIPFQALLQAIGPPLNPFGSSESPPTGPMGGGSVGGIVNGTPSAGVSASGQPMSDDPSVRPVSPPDKFPTGGGSASALSVGSQGVVGLKDLSLSTSAQASVVSSSTKNVHLDSGTQLILRTQ